MQGHLTKPFLKALCCVSCVETRGMGGIKMSLLHLLLSEDSCQNPTPPFHVQGNTDGVP